jgi:hypothetical protein
LEHFFTFFLGRLKWGFFGTFIDFFLVGGRKGGLLWFSFLALFWGRLHGGLFGAFFFFFFWHNFLISYKGAHLRDLFRGLGLPLFGLWAHLTKFLVALIGPFWVHFETLEHT